MLSTRDVGVYGTEIMERPDYSASNQLLYQLRKATLILTLEDKRLLIYRKLMQRMFVMS